MEGLRVIGDPNVYAKKYYDAGIDELLYIDLVASLYGRSNLANIVSATIADVFVPITVAGGIRSVEDARRLLTAGADKVAVNSAAVSRPELLNEIAQEFGSQALVLSIEAKSHGDYYEVFTDCGRESSGLKVDEWLAEGVSRGVGEVLITSIDCDGTMRGLDHMLISKISPNIDVPIVVSGGFAGDNCLKESFSSNIDGIAVGAALHFDRITIKEIKDSSAEVGFPIRKIQ